MFLPCSLRALCPSSPPCRVAVATIAAPRYPARGFVGAIPLPHPERPQRGVRKGQPPASALSAPLSAASLPVQPPRGLPILKCTLLYILALFSS